MSRNTRMGVYSEVWPEMQADAFWRQPLRAGFARTASIGTSGRHCVREGDERLWWILHEGRLCATEFWRLSETRQCRGGGSGDKTREIGLLMLVSRDPAFPFNPSNSLMTFTRTPILASNPTSIFLPAYTSGDRHDILEFVLALVLAFSDSCFGWSASLSVQFTSEISRL
jgi:hypothetical protein